ncbi:MAG TPA: class I SAM-dependent methyltransferase [Vicinamibacterales bacterium]|nr:class I SAM-dependent methyltransferase [Vicinamibacterales bacterium]
MTARAEREHFWFHGFRRFVRPLVRDAVRSLPRDRPLRLLDCGCGTGNNLLLLGEHGRAFGIDITYSGLAYAHEQGERRVAQASATDLPFPDTVFDLVGSFDVIYALDDAGAARALTEMYRVMRPGGYLVLNVAALPGLGGNHGVLGGEVQRYTRRSLRGHLEGAGFSVKRLTYTNASILPLVAGVRLGQKVLGHRESTREISVPPRPVNAALTAVLAVEAAALRYVNMPLGTSLLTLASRPWGSDGGQTGVRRGSDDGLTPV